MMAPGHQNPSMPNSCFSSYWDQAAFKQQLQHDPHQPKRSASPPSSPDTIMAPRFNAPREDSPRHSMANMLAVLATKHQLDGNELSKLAAELGATLTELSRARALLGSGDDRSEVVPIPLVGHSGRPASARREASGTPPSHSAPTPSALLSSAALDDAEHVQPCAEHGAPEPLLAHRNPTMPSTPFVGLPLGWQHGGSEPPSTGRSSPPPPASFKQWQAQAYTSPENNDPIVEDARDPLEVVLQKRAQVAAAMRSLAEALTSLSFALPKSRLNESIDAVNEALALVRYTADRATEGELQLLLRDLQLESDEAAQHEARGVPRPTREKLNVAEVAKAQRDVSASRERLRSAMAEAEEEEELQALRRMDIGKSSPSRRRVQFTGASRVAAGTTCTHPSAADGAEGAAPHHPLGASQPLPLVAGGAAHESGGGARPPPRGILKKQATFGSARDLLSGLVAKAPSFKDLAALTSSYLRRRRAPSSPREPSTPPSAQPPAPLRPQSPLTAERPLDPTLARSPRVDPIAARFQLDAAAAKSPQARAGVRSFDTEAARIMGGGGGGAGETEWTHTLSVEGQRKQQRIAEVQRQRREAQEAALAAHMPTGPRSQKALAFEC